MNKLLAAITLTLRFLWAVVMSGVATLKVVLRRRLGRGELPPAAFVRMRFQPMSPMGASLLGCMITLTPGTTTVDIDMDKRELLMHVLDASDVDAVIADVRAQFEPGLVVLFGERA
ncbi:MAG: Na+/H+ antiporter subunit E [Pseudomonadota bacterium]|nr:Na+/H+ antiporter subunit E [Pseudomonadota bacterium]